jgi:hypothetical protein
MLLKQQHATQELSPFNIQHDPSKSPGEMEKNGVPTFAEEGEGKQNGGMLVNMSPMLEGEAFHFRDG